MKKIKMLSKKEKVHQKKFIHNYVSVYLYPIFGKVFEKLFNNDKKYLNYLHDLLDPA